MAFWAIYFLFVILATSATATLSGMPHSPNRASSKMADAVLKIVDLQHEINEDIDHLVDLKREIMRMIKAIPNTEYQLILEKRYLCFMPWEQIAVDMGYPRSPRNFLKSSTRKIWIL